MKMVICYQFKFGKGVLAPLSQILQASLLLHSILKKNVEHIHITYYHG